MLMLLAWRPQLLGLEQGAEQINGEREDDGGVLLGADRVQRLQVAQLDGLRRLRDHIGRLLQGPGGLLLAFGHNHLRGGGGECESELGIHKQAWRESSPPLPGPLVRPPPLRPLPAAAEPAAAHPSLPPVQP
jgi:hypothetical protein